jgi:Putative prokaryotic signal transducing protein
MESHYIKIYTGNFIIVQLITTKLEDIGIEPIIKDESESGRLAGFGASIQGQQEVYVHENELNKALPIVEGVKAEMEA